MRRFLADRSPFVKGLIGAVLGTLATLVIAFLLVHAWFDHMLLHQLGDYINQVAPKIQKLP